MRFGSFLILFSRKKRKKKRKGKMKMASAQALPYSRKQEHLEARKRQLEEFHKEKAAEKGKKSASTPKPMFLMLA
ncbi:protein BLISTER isoform X2 [Gossypium hirsutum]|uniref:Protein BLISTER isoform X2 n=1 Tax=Gossypium hirsutum TaxID=3635 RepID=A0ABM3BIT3_GOSHI|nr:protein BLISTER-like isoform X2 [Gossypium hirsutum]